MADPRIIQQTVAAAKQTGADPAALLATEIVENGARWGLTPGDYVGGRATSYGSFQFHEGGALGSHAPSWVMTPDAFLNRAREFARLKVHGGKGAAAIQRPADPAGYAVKVQNALAEARRLVGQAPAAAPAGGAPAATGTPVLAGGRSLQSTIAAILSAKDPTAAFSQFQTGRGQVLITPPGATPGQAPAEPTFSGKPGVVTTFSAHPKIIGTPYSGTHTLGNWESDNAIDIALPKGTPIYAAFDGKIGSQFGALGSSSSRFAGLRLHLQGQGNELYYAHLSKFAPGIQPGTTVKRGQILGYSGVANGVAHLHLGSKNANPMSYA